MRFEIPFLGHKNIRSLHKNTIEITKDSSLTPSGDCIVGVNASFACKDIPNKIKKKLSDPKTQVTISIVINDDVFKIVGKGHRSISLTHPTDIVIRKSNFTCPRTLAVGCNLASDSLPRKMIKMIQKPESNGLFIIDVV